jgi:lysophospholipase L1-like esterase
MLKPRTNLANLPRRFLGSVAAIGLAAMLLGLPNLRAQSGRTAEHWVGIWATAVVSSQETPAVPRLLRQPAPTPQAGTPRPQLQPPLQVVNDQTLRQIVHTTLGGSRFRVVFTNAFGTAPLTIGAAEIALRAKEATIVPSAKRPLTFGGQRSTAIPAGAVTFSDPVDLTAAPFADLAIDLYVPGDTTGSPLTMHTGAFQTSYVSEAGDHTGMTEVPVARTVSSWYFLARVEAVAPASVGAVVTFGDSITDGTASTPNANQRWPDDLARRLTSGTGSGMSVLNSGIAGNRLLSDGRGINALARFDRDVSAETGVTHVVVLEGINDIGFAGNDPTPTTAELIGAHQQLIARARARGLKIFGATLTPFEGAAYQTTVGEAKRQELNKWIRTSGAYDGVIDFDAAVRDPSQPTKALAVYDPGDHLHFTDAGYQKMADTVDLNFLKLNKVKPTASR